MGTRQYAENVCRIIDPDGRMFANRILSRDESGSKSIRILSVKRVKVCLAEA